MAQTLQGRWFFLGREPSTAKWILKYSDDLVNLTSLGEITGSFGQDVWTIAAPHGWCQAATTTPARQFAISSRDLAGLKPEYYRIVNDDGSTAGDVFVANNTWAFNHWGNFDTDGTFFYPNNDTGLGYGYVRFRRPGSSSTKTVTFVNFLVGGLCFDNEGYMYLYGRAPSATLFKIRKYQKTGSDWDTGITQVWESGDLVASVNNQAYMRVYGDNVTAWWSEANGSGIYIELDPWPAETFFEERLQRSVTLNKNTGAGSGSSVDDSSASFFTNGIRVGFPVPGHPELVEYVGEAHNWHLAGGCVVGTNITDPSSSAQAGYLYREFEFWSDMSVLYVPNYRPIVTAISINDGATYTKSPDKNTVDNTDIVPATPLLARYLIELYDPDTSTWENKGYTDWFKYLDEITDVEIFNEDGTQRLTGEFANNEGFCLNRPTDTIIFDRVAPQNIVADINSGAAYTNSLSVLLGLHAEDNAVPIAGRWWNDEDPEPAGWTDIIFMVGAWDYETSWALKEGADGTRYVDAIFKDAAGNETIIISGSIILDRVPPHDVSISINGGASTTDDPDVVLTLTAVDDATPLQMKVSEDETFTGVPWEPFVTTKNFTLSEPQGYKTVYFKAKDAAGNESDTTSDSIEYSTEDLVEVGTISGDVTLTLKSVFSDTSTVLRPPVLILEVNFLNDKKVTQGLLLGILELQNSEGQVADKSVYMATSDTYRPIFCAKTVNESGNYRVYGVLQMNPQQWDNTRIYTIHFKFTPHNNADKVKYLSATFNIQNQVAAVLLGPKTVMLQATNLKSQQNYQLQISGVKDKLLTSELQGAVKPFQAPEITGSNLIP